MRAFKQTRTRGATGHGQSKKRLNAQYIKGLVNPLDFYRHELPNVQLNKAGWNDGGLCPCHTDNNPGSFRINTDTGAFICFACGASGGDIINFTMAKHGLSFPDALAKLVNDWGLI